VSERRMCRVCGVRPVRPANVHHSNYICAHCEHMQNPGIHRRSVHNYRTSAQGREQHRWNELSNRRARHIREGAL
jgi:hypothetical protein